MRFVTHCDVDEAEIERALTVLQEVAAQPYKGWEHENADSAGIGGATRDSVASLAIACQRRRRPKIEVRKARRDPGAAPTVEEAQAFLADAEVAAL